MKYEKWKIKSGKYEFRKNFFALTLHPYIATLCILLYLNNLQRFQIFSNPTLTLHQPYTNHACQGMKLIINNE